jgi:EAL domain-containing protein (putative c-di-GMP-specific phosphodiesterase class I)
MSVGAGVFRVRGLRCIASPLMDRACSTPDRETLFITQALDAAHTLPAGVSVWIGVPARALDRAGCRAAIRDAAAAWPGALGRLVVELRDTKGASLRAVNAVLAPLMRAGARLALGAEFDHSGFEAILQLFPEYLVVYPELLDGCATDHRRQAVLEAIGRMAPRLGAKVMASGVARMADLEVLTSVGIDLVEGPFFGRLVPLGVFTQACANGGDALRALVSPRAWTEQHPVPPTGEVVDRRSQRDTGWSRTPWTGGRSEDRT